MWADGWRRNVLGHFIGRILILHLMQGVRAQLVQFLKESLKIKKTPNPRNPEKNFCSRGKGGKNKKYMTKKLQLFFRKIKISKFSLRLLSGRRSYRDQKRYFLGKNGQIR